MVYSQRLTPQNKIKVQFNVYLSALNNVYREIDTALRKLLPNHEHIIREESAKDLFAPMNKHHYNL